MALARACYADADTYLLDDPLSAVDAAVGAHIFQKCIQGLLAGKTRVLATHQLQYLPGADLVMVLERGAVQNLGRWAGVEAYASSLFMLQFVVSQGALITPAWR